MTWQREKVRYETLQNSRIIPPKRQCSCKITALGGELQMLNRSVSWYPSESD